ncbi:MAG TPA: hypothetical protein PKX92_04735 [Edaphocola sp.]|nr:hypothetical protein [Edaphocola sp.]
MKKIIGFLVLILVVGISGYTYWNYLRVFDEGVREGIIQKFSRKGAIFKTYEGELLGGGFGRVGATGFQAQYFYFSVEDPEIANFIEKNAGKNMTVHFVKYRKSLPWRGDNYNNKNQEDGQYIVDRATVSDAASQQQNRGAIQQTQQQPQQEEYQQEQVPQEESGDPVGY